MGGGLEGGEEWRHVDQLEDTCTSTGGEGQMGESTRVNNTEVLKEMLKVSTLQ